MWSAITIKAATIRSSSTPDSLGFFVLAIAMEIKTCNLKRGRKRKRGRERKRKLGRMPVGDENFLTISITILKLTFLQISDYSPMASLMQSTMYLTSSSETIGPAGRQKPILKRSSSTLLV